MTDDRRLSLEDVLCARQRIAGHLAETPARSSWIDAPAPLHLKLECWQPTGSFKVRGAVNAMAGDPGRGFGGNVDAAVLSRVLAPRR